MSNGILWQGITKATIKKYPYMGVVTMLIGAITFLVSGGANIINHYNLITLLSITFALLVENRRVELNRL